MNEMTPRRPGPSPTAVVLAARGSRASWARPAPARSSSSTTTGWCTSATSTARTGKPDRPLWTDLPWSWTDDTTTYYGVDLRDLARTGTDRASTRAAVAVQQLPPLLRDGAGESSGRVHRAAQHPARHHRRRHRRQRRRSRPAVPRTAARCRAHGRPHANHGRRRGDEATRRRAQRRRPQGAGAHHLRPRSPAARPRTDHLSTAYSCHFRNTLEHVGPSIPERDPRAGHQVGDGRKTSTSPGWAAAATLAPIWPRYPPGPHLPVCRPTGCQCHRQPRHERRVPFAALIITVILGLLRAAWRRRCTCWWRSRSAPPPPSAPGRKVQAWTTT